MAILKGRTLPLEPAKSALTEEISPALEIVGAHLIEDDQHDKPRIGLFVLGSPGATGSVLRTCV
jgi:hypothetical protein